MTKEDVAQVHKTSAQERMTLEDLDKEVAREWASVHPPTATITKERLAHVNRIDAHGQRILEDIEKHDLKAAEDRKRLLRMEELYRKYLSDLDAGIAGLEQDPTRPPPTLLLPKDCYDFVIGFHREEEAEMDEMRLRLLECMTPDKLYLHVQNSIMQRLERRRGRMYSLTRDDFVAVMREVAQHDPEIRDALRDMSTKSKPLASVSREVFDKWSKDQDNNDDHVPPLVDEHGKPLTRAQLALNASINASATTQPRGPPPLSNLERNRKIPVKTPGPCDRCAQVEIGDRFSYLITVFHTDDMPCPEDKVPSATANNDDEPPPLIDFVQQQPPSLERIEDDEGPPSLEDASTQDADEGPPSLEEASSDEDDGAYDQPWAIGEQHVGGLPERFEHSFKPKPN